MALRLTIKSAPRVLDGRPRTDTVYQAEDEDGIVDAWNASGEWSYLGPDEFREVIAEMSGIELPASDDEILEAAVAASDGNMELTVVDDVASRIGATLLDR